MTNEKKYWRYLLRTDASEALIADALAAVRRVKALPPPVTGIYAGSLSGIYAAIPKAEKKVIYISIDDFKASLK